MYKSENGKLVELTPEEEAKVRAEWDFNLKNPPPPPEPTPEQLRLGALETSDITKGVEIQLLKDEIANIKLKTGV